MLPRGRWDFHKFLRGRDSCYYCCIRSREVFRDAPILEADLHPRHAGPCEGSSAKSEGPDDRLDSFLLRSLLTGPQTTPFPSVRWVLHPPRSSASPSFPITFWLNCFLTAGKNSIPKRQSCSFQSSFSDKTGSYLSTLKFNFPFVVIEMIESGSWTLRASRSPVVLVVCCSTAYITPSLGYAVFCPSEKLKLQLSYCGACFCDICTTIAPAIFYREGNEVHFPDGRTPRKSLRRRDRPRFFFKSMNLEVKKTTPSEIAYPVCNANVYQVRSHLKWRFSGFSKTAEVFLFYKCRSHFKSCNSGGGIIKTLFAFIKNSKPF